MPRALGTRNCSGGRWARFPHLLSLQRLHRGIVEQASRWRPDRSTGQW